MSTPPPPPRRRGPPPAAAFAVLLACAVGAGVWALGPDRSNRPGPTLVVALSTPPAGSPPPHPAPDDTAGTGTAPAPAPTLADRTHGWGVPLPAGWTAEPATERAAVVEVAGRYACGQSAAPCPRGRFAIAADSVGAADAQRAAEREMAAFAPEVFGELRAHREESAGTLTVAGREGWAIRWYAEPWRGAAGHVVVAAVADPHGTGYVVLRGGVDDDPGAPAASVLDGIIRGITAV
ncbi:MULTISPECIES: hypothetical protein [Kitasatospora]|uniref:hypothetical protein n=1 Tax=Kitasatospora TaxID=2063 RepID=UPI0002DE05F4|nr:MULTISPECIES: hypothetical protein [Kitasatospora]